MGPLTSGPKPIRKMKEKKFKYWDKDSICEIIDSLDNSICSHKFDIKHHTEGHMRGNSYSGGDIWTIYCVRCSIKRDYYAVSICDDVDWDKIKRMKEKYNIK